jgi:hypothetical protein
VFVHVGPRSSAGLAVILAVSDRMDRDS